MADRLNQTAQVNNAARPELYAGKRCVYVIDPLLVRNQLVSSYCLFLRLPSVTSLLPASLPCLAWPKTWAERPDRGERGGEKVLGVVPVWREGPALLAAGPASGLLLWDVGGADTWQADL